MEKIIILVNNLGSLSDSDLNELSVLVSQESRQRAYAKFDRGEFAPLDQAEKDLLALGKKIEAMKNYKDRTKQSLYLCYSVVNHYLDLGEECDCQMSKK